MPQIRRGLRTSFRVWMVVWLEGRSALGRHRQWKEKPKEKCEKEGESRQERWEEEEVEARTGKTAYEKEKWGSGEVRKSIVFTLIGTS